jgi:hypothetical protein
MPPLGVLLLLPAPDRGGTNAAETLVRSRAFAASARNLQQTVAVRGANPRFSGCRSSKSAANQQQTSNAPPSQPTRADEVALWRSARASRARAEKIRIK